MNQRVGNYTWHVRGGRMMLSGASPEKLF